MPVQTALDRAARADQREHRPVRCAAPPPVDSSPIGRAGELGAAVENEDHVFEVGQGDIRVEPVGQAVRPPEPHLANASPGRERTQLVTECGERRRVLGLAGRGRTADGFVFGLEVERVVRHETSGAHRDRRHRRHRGHRGHRGHYHRRRCGRRLRLSSDRRSRAETDDHRAAALDERLA